MMVQELIEKVRGWQIAKKEYETVFAESPTPETDNSKFWARRHNAQEAQNAAASPLGTYGVDYKVLSVLVALSDEIDRLRDENLQLLKTVGYPFEEAYGDDDDGDGDSHGNYSHIEVH